jgi:hypothetical protein
MNKYIGIADNYLRMTPSMEKPYLAFYVRDNPGFTQSDISDLWIKDTRAYEAHLSSLETIKALFDVEIGREYELGKDFERAHQILCKFHDAQGWRDVWISVLPANYEYCLTKYRRIVALPISKPKDNVASVHTPDVDSVVTPHSGVGNSVEQEPDNERIIFLDIDGVMNCQVFYDRVGHQGEERLRNICGQRIEWLNDLCACVKADVVISSTWRLGKTVDELKELLREAGATFNVVDKTPVLNGKWALRGNEILLWIQASRDDDFKDYVIIDDDSDMLLWQQRHFFQVDSYSGLTPNTCYRIKKFFGVDPYKSAADLLNQQSK